MKKYYIILTLIFVAGCGSDSVSEHKKESALEKKSVVKIEADKNVVKAKEPKSRKIASQRSKNRNVKNRKPIQSKKQKNKTNTPRSLDKIKAPDFLLSDLEGNIFDLSAFSGQVIMLTFWGTWCGPCRREIPDFIRLYDEYNDDGLEIIGVAVQS